MSAADSRRTPPARRRLRPQYRARSQCATSVTYLLRYLIAEPGDAAYALPRRLACRLACRLFGWHTTVCRGRPDHHPSATRPRTPPRRRRTR